MEKKKLSVLKKDLEGSSGFLSVHNCPLAIAFKRQFPEYSEVCVGPYHIHVRDEGTWKRFAWLEDKFGSEEYAALKDKGKEFHTMLELV